MKYYENPSPDKWDEILKRPAKKTKELHEVEAKDIEDVRSNGASA